MKISTLEQAGKYYLSKGLVNFTNMTVDGVTVLDTCGYSYNKKNRSDKIKQQISKHSFTEGVDYTLDKSCSPWRYDFTFNAANHTLLAAMTDSGKAARQEAINLKESTPTSNNEVVLTGDPIMDMMAIMMKERAAVLAIETKQKEHDIILEQQSIKLDAIESKTVILPNRPQNAESISAIRTRINHKYGLPHWVINEVLNTFTYAPRPAGQVRNTHVEGGDVTYTVWNIAEVNRLFERFIRECESYSPTKVVHDLIDKPFKCNQ